MLPDNWKHVCPVRCYGDGNCLYRYVYNIIEVTQSGIGLVIQYTCWPSPSNQRFYRQIPSHQRGVDDVG